MLQEHADLIFSGDPDGKPIANSVFEVLSKEWPLSPKQIFRQIEGKSHVAVLRSAELAAQVKPGVKGVFAK